jgi:mucin-19
MGCVVVAACSSSSGGSGAQDAGHGVLPDSGGSSGGSGSSSGGGPGTGDGGGSVCVGGAGGFPAASGGKPPIGSVSFDANGTSVTLPVCPGFVRCTCNPGGGGASVTGALDDGQALVMTIDNTQKPSAQFQYTVGTTSYCGTGTGSVSTTGTTGSMATGTFSGSVVEGMCTGSPTSTTVALTNGAFSCACGG